jgi:hypothetical protein
MAGLIRESLLWLWAAACRCLQGTSAILEGDGCLETAQEGGDEKGAVIVGVQMPMIRIGTSV